MLMKKNKENDEYAQIDDKNVFDPLMASKLSRSDKRKALRMIALIKNKTKWKN